MGFYSQYMKRPSDVVGAIAALTVTFPVAAAVSLAIRTTMGSPTIFRQPRPGLNENVFVLFKFRTMHHGDEPDSDRLTSLGRFLRKSSLDELPQLINILRGEMSFIGPRPLAVQYLDVYTAEERRRHSVRPGVSGLAQVSGRNSLSWEERFELDLSYVDDISFINDIKLVWMTLKRVVRRVDVGVRDVNGQGDLDVLRRPVGERLPFHEADGLDQ